jgi:nucleoid-associated protein
MTTKNGGMIMNINHLIIHELLKTAGETASSIDLSKDTLPIDESCQDLIENLDKLYKTKITYAVFDEAPEKTFPKKFKTYNDNCCKESFVEFSTSTLELLMQQIQGIAPAKGGYFVYADYETERANFIGIFLIRNVKGVLFQKDSQSSTFKINPVIHIDLDKMAMACRINKKLYPDTNIRYLSFIKNRIPDISDYFIHWIAAKNAENNTTDTKYLCDIFNKIEMPNDEQGNPIPREEVKKKVYSYIKESPTSTVDLNDLSRFIFQDENKLIDFAEQQQIPINCEFIPDNKVLKKFIQIDVEADGIKIRFSHALLNEKIRIDEARLLLNLKP